MSHITPEARAQAGETKKRRTREKLIHAADYKMHDEGWHATIESICEDAGIGVSTFYNFYTSRNELCVDAFTELVVVPLEQTASEHASFEDTARALVRLCENRTNLLRAALIGRLEASPLSTAERVTTPLTATKNLLGSAALRVDPRADFVYRIAKVLPDDTMLADGECLGEIQVALPMAALRLLDSIAIRDHLVNYLTLARVAAGACNPPQRNPRM